MARIAGKYLQLLDVFKFECRDSRRLPLSSWLVNGLGMRMYILVEITGQESWIVHERKLLQVVIRD